MTVYTLTQFAEIVWDDKFMGSGQKIVYVGSDIEAAQTKAQEIIDNWSPTDKIVPLEWMYWPTSATNAVTMWRRDYSIVQPYCQTQFKIERWETK